MARCEPLTTCILGGATLRPEAEGVPAHYLMLLECGADVPMICKQCVAQQQIHTERLTDNQNRIWFDGEKYLSYGGVFVKMN
jgi:hypothetical protein